MVEKYIYYCDKNTIRLFYVDEENFTYNEVVAFLINKGYDPFAGKEKVKILLQYWARKKIILPNGQNFIIGLDRKENLQKEIYPCGTILYYIPFIFSSLDGKKWITKTCFSESDAVNNFYRCYIVAVKL